MEAPPRFTLYDVKRLGLGASLTDLSPLAAIIIVAGCAAVVKRFGEFAKG